MAVLAGRTADIYIATGTGTAMTGEAVTSLGSGVYQITDSAKRAINPTAALTVLDGVATVPAQNYEVVWGTGKIRLTNGYTLVGTMTVTGEYLSLSQAAQGYEWTLDVQTDLEETQTFGDSWKERTAINRSATISFQRFYEDEYFHTNIGNRYVLALYIDQPSGTYYTCAAHVTSQGITVGENETVKENVQFAADGPVDFVT